MTSKNCDGACLSQASYRNWKRTFQCHQGCTLTECPNFTFCQNKSPVWLLAAHGGRCYACNITFGIDLTMSTSIQAECPICMEEVSAMIKMPSCSHEFCVVCLRRLYHYKPDLVSEIISTDEINLNRENESEEKSNEDEQLYPELDEDQEGDIPTKCFLCRNIHVQPWNKRH